MTTFVFDSFTGSGNLEAHVGETGATWVLNAGFGPGASGELILSGGKLTRPAFPTANSSGEALAYASGIVSGSFFIEAPVSFANITDSAAVAFYDTANGGGSARPLAQLGSNFHPDSVHNLVVWNPGIATAGVNFTVAAATSYVFRLEVTSSFYTIFIGGVQKVQIARTASPSNQYGISIFEGASTAVVSVDSITIGSLAPPGPRWTNYVATTETTA